MNNNAHETDARRHPLHHHACYAALLQRRGVSSGGGGCPPQVDLLPTLLPRLLCSKARMLRPTVHRPVVISPLSNRALLLKCRSLKIMEGDAPFLVLGSLRPLPSYHTIVLAKVLILANLV